MYHMAKGNGYALFLIFPTYMYPLGTASFSRKKSESFDEWCSKWNGKTILLSQKSPNKLRAFEWVPADVAFVARFHQIVGFQAKSCHIKNCLRRNTTSKLSAITTKTGTRKLAKQKLWKCSTFLAGFFAVIAWLTSNLIYGNAIVALIYEIVASSMVIFATWISSESDTHT